MRRVAYHPKAPGEARELYQYYLENSERLADRFWAELMSSIECAAEFPKRHHFDRTGLRRANLKTFPVHFLFRLFRDHIRITTIRHDRQDPRHGARRQ